MKVLSAQSSWSQTDKQPASKQSASKRYPTDEKGRVFAFGEWKHPSEWAKDPRCVCSFSALTRRLAKGLSAEEAITASVSLGPAPSKTLTAWGETKLLAEWVRDPRTVISESTLHSRMKDPARWPSVEEMLSTPILESKIGHLITINGVTKSLANWARDPNCPYSESALRTRLLKKQSFDAPNAQGKKNEERERRAVEALDAFEEAGCPYGELPTSFPFPKRLVTTKYFRIRLNPYCEKIALSAAEFCAALVMWWEGEALL